MTGINVVGIALKTISLIGEMMISVPESDCQDRYGMPSAFGYIEIVEGLYKRDLRLGGGNGRRWGWVGKETRLNGYACNPVV